MDYMEHSERQIFAYYGNEKKPIHAVGAFFLYKGKCVMTTETRTFFSHRHGKEITCSFYKDIGGSTVKGINSIHETMVYRFMKETNGYFYNQQINNLDEMDEDTYKECQKHYMLITPEATNTVYLGKGKYMVNFVCLTDEMFQMFKEMSGLGSFESDINEREILIVANTSILNSVPVGFRLCPYLNFLRRNYAIVQKRIYSAYVSKPYSTSSLNLFGTQPPLHPQTLIKSSPSIQHSLINLLSQDVRLLYGL